MPLLGRAAPADPRTSFAGRTILVTGSNIGLGLAAAEKFALLNANRVILAVRDVGKGATARSQIESSVREKNKSTAIEVWQLDMGDYNSIKDFSARAAKELDRLDVAILNAGVFKQAFSRGKYGWEETLQVNTLSTTLLGLLLLPVLRRTAQKFPDAQGMFPVLELVSSGLHRKVELTEAEQSEEVTLLEHFNTPDSYAGQKQYGRSKLFLMYALAEMAKLGAPAQRGEGGKVWVTSVCPGLCFSNLSRDYTQTWYFALLLRIAALLFMRTSEEGARTYVSGATHGEKGRGGFWQNDEIKPPIPLLEGEVGERLQSQVWHELLNALRKDVPDIMELLHS